MSSISKVRARIEREKSILAASQAAQLEAAKAALAALRLAKKDSAEEASVRMAAQAVKRAEAEIRSCREALKRACPQERNRLHSSEGSLRAARKELRLLKNEWAVLAPLATQSERAEVEEEIASKEALISRLRALVATRKDELAAAIKKTGLKKALSSAYADLAAQKRALNKARLGAEVVHRPLAELEQLLK